MAKTVNRRRIRIKKKLTKSNRRKMTGGVSFNTPSGSFTNPIEYNRYDGGDPSRDVIASRNLPFSHIGGKTRRKRHNKKRTGKKIKRRRGKSRKMRGGGSLVGTDIVTGLNTSNTNQILAFGTTGGSEYLMNEITEQDAENGSNLIPKDHMIPMA
jgi:hypothetical protein